MHTGAHMQTNMQLWLRLCRVLANVRRSNRSWIHHLSFFSPGVAPCGKNTQVTVSDDIISAYNNDYSVLNCTIIRMICWGTAQKVSLKKTDSATNECQTSIVYQQNLLSTHCRCLKRPYLTWWVFSETNTLKKWRFFSARLSRFQWKPWNAGCRLPAYRAGRDSGRLWSIKVSLFHFNSRAPSHFFWASSKTHLCLETTGGYILHMILWSVYFLVQFMRP